MTASTHQKKALVTGASEGIGRAFALKLAQEGYSVTAVARNEARLKDLIPELESSHGATHFYRVKDLSKAEDVAALSSEFAKEHYDLLVNNAGSGVYGKFYELPLERLQQMTRLNCDAVVALSHAFLGSARKGDALINVASTLAFLPFPQAGLYAATKAFVTSFSESLWFEQKGRDIYVMNLCPGITATNFHSRSGGDAKDTPPTALTQTAEQVVDVAYKALLKRREPTVISGVKNRAMANLTRLMPRKATVSMMGGMR